MVAFPHYDLVPKDLKANLRWRKEMLLGAAEDASFAANVKQMCAEDCLFYLNGFGWTYDPRDTSMPNKPFITYKEFQDEAIEMAIDAIEVGYDIAWPKSRTMGASWMGLSVFEWMWHFRDSLAFGLVSRNEKYVDQAGNPKSLMWKIDYLHKNQPMWLLPTGRHRGWNDPNRKILHLENADTGSVIDGESTTGEVFRGGRLTGLFMDELAAFEVNEGYAALRSSRDVTKCRMFNSTPQGSANAMHDVVFKSGAKVFYMRWQKHPEYNEALYTSHRQEDGTFKVELLDDFVGFVKTMRQEWTEKQTFLYPEEYPFILDGKERSPWYDAEGARCVSKQEIAQELDIDFLGSSYQYFDQEFIKILVAEYCSEPVLRGRLVFDPVTLEPLGFEIDEKGPLALWFNLLGGGSLLQAGKAFDGKRYGLGSDVSFGTGASNSATAIVDLSNGRKIARWKDPHTDPEDFCDETIALAKWFNNGFMIWDASGSSGRSFTKRLLEQRYSRIYYRRNEEKTRSRISDQPGYFLNPEDRSILLRDYRGKLSNRTFINPSEEGMNEMLQFIVQPGGKVEHSAAANSQDPTGAREAHGDEVIADALASRLLTLTPYELKEAATPEAPWMSPAWRLQQEALELAEAESEDW